MPAPSLQNYFYVAMISNFTFPLGVRFSAVMDPQGHEISTVYPYVYVSYSYYKIRYPNCDLPNITISLV